MTPYRRTVGRSRSTRRSSSFRRGGSRRTSVWVRSVNTSSVGLVANYGANLIGSGALDPGARIGSTVTRCLLTVELLGAELTSASGGLFMGLTVVNTTGWTDAAQPPALPFTHMNSVDWMFWRYVPYGDEQVGTLLVAATRTFNYNIDARSKRRLTQPDENLMFAVQNNGIPGTTGINIVSSVLLKLA